MHVAAVDTTTSENGGTAFLATGAPRTGAGSWISPGRQALTLGARSTTRLRFRVRIPGSAEPGDHVGGIVIEPDRKVQVDGPGDITRIVRVAIAVRIRVPGDARAALAVDRLRAAHGAGNGGPTLTVQLANTGARLCRPYLTATFSTAGEAISSERRHLETLLPRTTVDYTLAWRDPVPDGTYDVRVRTEGCGAPSAVSERLVLDSATNAVRIASASPAITPTTTGLPRGAQLAAGAGLMLAALAAGAWLARRGPRRS